MGKDDNIAEISYDPIVVAHSAVQYLLWTFFVSVDRNTFFNMHIFLYYSLKLAGGDIRQKLEFHHVHLELGALGYIETFLFYWSWGFFQKKTHHGRFSFLKTQGSPLWI